MKVYPLNIFTLNEETSTNVTFVFKLSKYPKKLNTRKFIPAKRSFF